MAAQLELPDVETIFDTHSEDYEGTTNRSIGFSGLKVDFFIRAKANHLLQELANLYGNTSTLSLLDIGCGVGKYHALIKDHVGSVEGVEVSSDSLAIARRANPDVGYTHYDGRRLPYADASFDVAYTVCVMHHVPPRHWEKFAREMMRVLKPGGSAFVFEHNPLNPLTRKAVNDCPYDADAVLLRPREVKELFEAAGAEKYRNAYILSVPAAGGVLKKIDGLFSKIPTGAQYCAQFQRA